AGALHRAQCRLPQQRRAAGAGVARRARRCGGGRAGRRRFRWRQDRRPLRRAHRLHRRRAHLRRPRLPERLPLSRRLASGAGDRRGDPLRLRRQHDLAARAAARARRVRRRLLRLSRGRRLRLADVAQRRALAVRAARGGPPRLQRHVEPPRRLRARRTLRAQRAADGAQERGEPARDGRRGALRLPLSPASLHRHPQQQGGRAVARAVHEDEEAPRQATALRPRAAGDDRRSAHRDAVPRAALDRRARGAYRREARGGAEVASARRWRDLRQVPAAGRADLSRRRRADARRAVPRAAAVDGDGHQNAVRYHAGVTTWWRRFLVRGVFWRQFLHWAVRTVPPWIEPAAIAFWSLFFLLWGPGRRGVMRNLTAIKPGSTALVNFFRCYRVFWNYAWSIDDTMRFKEEGTIPDWDFAGP